MASCSHIAVHSMLIGRAAALDNLIILNSPAHLSFYASYTLGIHHWDNNCLVLDKGSLDFLTGTLALPLEENDETSSYVSNMHMTRQDFGR